MLKTRNKRLLDTLPGHLDLALTAQVCLQFERKLAVLTGFLPSKTTSVHI